MSKRFVRIETSVGDIHWINADHIIAINPYNKKNFNSGATIIISTGGTPTQLSVAPGKETNAIADFLGISI